MKKVYVSWNDVQRQVQELIRQMWTDGWTPDYVVGITRGGLTPANLISQYLGCRMETLKVSLRDGSECESNLWMAEDAYGYIPHEGQVPAPKDRVTSDPALRKKILIVDDINDSGATLSWIHQDWPSGCMANDPAWKEVWGDNVRVAVLYDNAASTSTLPVNYAAENINKFEDPQWIVFPWEEWWRRWNPQEEHQ
jgi:hypoxanthine phosphoribosyltransferase